MTEPIGHKSCSLEGDVIPQLMCKLLAGSQAYFVRTDSLPVDTAGNRLSTHGDWCCRIMFKPQIDIEDSVSKSGDQAINLYREWYDLNFYRGGCRFVPHGERGDEIHLALDEKLKIFLIPTDDSHKGQRSEEHVLSPASSSASATVSIETAAHGMKPTITWQPPPIHCPERASRPAIELNYDGERSLILHTGTRRPPPPRRGRSQLTSCNSDDEDMIGGLVLMGSGNGGNREFWLRPTRMWMNGSGQLRPSPYSDVNVETGIISVDVYGTIHSISGSASEALLDKVSQRYSDSVGKPELCAEATFDGRTAPASDAAIPSASSRSEIRGSVRRAAGGRSTHTSPEQSSPGGKYYDPVVDRFL